ncbi:hypothetical protein Y032_0017g3178 [Ancylostoma ceylanicum]|nr:hypothetical protein Y032_0017g3178 [Ancylostoma ceylanicum]
MAQKSVWRKSPKRAEHQVRCHRTDRDEEAPTAERHLRYWKIIVPWNRGVGGVGVLVNTNLAKNVDSFEQLKTRIGRLRLRRCGSTPAVTVFVAYAPTSSYDEDEIKTFYMDLEKFYREDHTLYKVVVGDFNAKIGPRRTPEELHIGTHGLQWNEQGERLSEFIMTTKTIHGNSQFPTETESTTSSSIEGFA